jgi:predicted MFS family arabinose efflux permease
LAPVFSAELALRAADLGLLAGAYFLGFSLMQLPLGQALDRHGPRRVLLVLMVVAICGCAAFAMSGSLGSLVISRAAIGVGVSACLMAPLTCYRRIYPPGAQLRSNSWMLMTGSLGMMTSTMPVQWLTPLIGWRGLFWGLAGLLVVAAISIHALAPKDPPRQAVAGATSGYREILRHPLFVRMAPMAFFIYGGLIAVQALWAGPWLTRVAGWSDSEAAAGLLLVNASMLVTFLGWGMLMPRLTRRGIGAERLMAWGLPLALATLCGIVVAGADAGAWSWAAWCVCCSVVTLSQPAIGQAFPLSAGRCRRSIS